MYATTTMDSTLKIVNWSDNTPASNMPGDASPTASSVLNWLLPAIKEERAQRWNMSPEMLQVNDDLTMKWATKLMELQRDVLKGFVEKVLLQTIKDTWVILDAETRGAPCFRRGFATALHEFAIEGEKEGWVIGEGYAKFVRERYNPPHRFACEK